LLGLRGLLAVGCGWLVACDWFLFRVPPPFNFISDLTIFVRRARGEGYPSCLKEGGRGYPPLTRVSNFNRV
jgi:hypothetical protein